jgi:hypothetical protein
MYSKKGPLQGMSGHEKQAAACLQHLSEKAIFYHVISD